MLKEAIKEALRRADHDRDTGRTVGWVEHGGWMLWKKRTRNTFSYLIKDPKTATNTPPGYPFLDGGTRVWLHEPPSPPKGWEFVAIFHVHPNSVGIPEDTPDTAAADAVKVPGFVGQPDGQIFMVGNFDRGIINRDLPRRCR